VATLPPPEAGCARKQTVLTDKPEWSSSERNRENAWCEQYFLIQVTCKMNAKDQTWNENIWTVTTPI